MLSWKHSCWLTWVVLLEQIVQDLLMAICKTRSARCEFVATDACFEASALFTPQINCPTTDSLVRDRECPSAPAKALRMKSLIFQSAWCLHSCKIGQQNTDIQSPLVLPRDLHLLDERSSTNLCDVSGQGFTEQPERIWRLFYSSKIWYISIYFPVLYIKYLMYICILCIYILYVYIYISETNLFNDRVDGFLIHGVLFFHGRFRWQRCRGGDRWHRRPFLKSESWKPKNPAADIGQGSLNYLFGGIKLDANLWWFWGISRKK